MCSQQHPLYLYNTLSVVDISVKFSCSATPSNFFILACSKSGGKPLKNSTWDHSTDHTSRLINKLFYIIHMVWKFQADADIPTLPLINGHEFLQLGPPVSISSHFHPSHYMNIHLQLERDGLLPHEQHKNILALSCK